MELLNHSPFPATLGVLFDKAGAELLVVTVKATYAISEAGKLAVAENQDPVRFADEFRGEPGLSSIRYEGELEAGKPATDVILNGSAVAPRPGTRQIDVGLRVGPLTKHVTVFGNRRWKRSLFGHAPSEPEPFDRLALIYENAFGGKEVDPDQVTARGQEPRNPVGKGFRLAKSRLDLDATPLPNIEDPQDLLRKPGHVVPPQGFGFIGRDWQPRLGYAGTYDAKWREARMPLLPLDFDERYHNAAHPDLVAKGYLRGDEAVVILGATLAGRLEFALPRITVSAEATLGNQREPVRLNLNTVLIDTDGLRLNLLWKGGLNIHRRLPHLKRVECRTHNPA